MSFGISLIVLVAAVLHASWNALLRGGNDRLWSMTIMCIAIAVACALMAPFVPVPSIKSWGYLAMSALLHVGYNLFLVRTYRQGDLGQTYPIARGASPLLVSLGAAVFACELPDALSLTGVLLVSCGIVALAFQGRTIGPQTLLFALGTGCFIGAYSVTDGIGARLSGSSVGYIVWMCLSWGLLMPATYVILRDARSIMRAPREMLVAGSGGLASLLAYGIVIVAMSLGPMGPVSALRETSVVFAALIGRIFLGETLTRCRIAACLVVAAGAVLIGHGG
ncbi:drug/metabolite transporter (DMT)-like permease [Sphingomonas sp. SORGH_AS870]|uniref:DMT family transporter n=1 Tax=Sphingomonas sp. SORGH_AS_0870 TaxID=3041801 RepID=UPI00285D15D3|nr:DMT family transporter [Sphingomonas sp. SORGH_AS_0870]MDR6146219.1 drug/metabolite transporter (DMT)-like permease [Sphingomonas sp. SORGH_AS_0870]